MGLGGGALGGMGFKPGTGVVQLVAGLLQRLFPVVQGGGQTRLQIPPPIPGGNQQAQGQGQSHGQDNGGGRKI
ncbi:hypothetical protein JCM17960_10230 [Magnetospira thiophila]